MHSKISMTDEQVLRFKVTGWHFKGNRKVGAEYFHHFWLKRALNVQHFSGEFTSVHLFVTYTSVGIKWRNKTLCCCIFGIHKYLVPHRHTLTRLHSLLCWGEKTAIHKELCGKFRSSSIHHRNVSEMREDGKRAARWEKKRIKMMQNLFRTKRKSSHKRPKRWMHPECHEMQ